MGVGHKKYPFPEMRGAAGCRGKHLPLCIVPERGQVLQNSLNPKGEQPSDIFDDCIFWPDFTDKPRKLDLQATSRSLLNPSTLTANAYILAGKAAA